jgi:hypothetical protein
MKIQILRACVLMVSISAASVLVWNATRDQKPEEVEEKQEEDKISPKKMQGSSKARVVIDPENIIEITQEETGESQKTPHSDSTVTDEEVKRMREAMLSTSKSGKVMSDDQIREMLEERKKEIKLMPSSKVSSAILRSKDLEEMIEGKKPDQSDLQELPPQEE